MNLTIDEALEELFELKKVTGKLQNYLIWVWAI